MTGPRRRSWRWIVSASCGVLLLGATGCATGRQQTSRQLEDGERLVSGWVDAATWKTGSDPSPMFVTGRLGGQYTRGIRDLGDVSYHLSTSHLLLPGAGVWILDVGVTGRWYVSDLWTAGLQLQTGFVRDGVNGLGALAVQARVGTTTTPDRPYYGAVHLWAPAWRGDFGAGVGTAVGGIAVGTEISPFEDGPTVQAEIGWSPLLVASGPRARVGRMITVAFVHWPLTVSVGGHWRLPYE